MKPLKVAVSALHRGENPQPGPSVIKSIRRLHPNTKIIGLSYDPLDSGLYVHGDEQPDVAYLMSHPSKGPEALLDRLTEIHNEWQLDMVVPNQDFEIQNYIDIRDDLKVLGIRVGLPSQKAFDRRGKDKLYQLCKAVGIRSPKTILANDAEEALQAAEEIGFPVMLKGRMYGAAQADTPGDIPGVFETMQSLWGGHVLVQALVESNDEFSTIGLGDGKGNVVGSCSIRKVLLTSNGKTFGAVVIRNPTLKEATEKVVRALKWYGPFELEFIGDSKGVYQLIEMNPRFPSWCDFPSQINCNLPSALISMALFDNHPAIAECEPGNIFVRHCVDLAGDLRQLAGLLSTGQMQCIPPQS